MTTRNRFGTIRALTWTPAAAVATMPTRRLAASTAVAAGSARRHDGPPPMNRSTGAAPPAAGASAWTGGGAAPGADNGAVAATRLAERAQDKDPDATPAGARRVGGARLPELLEAPRHLVAAHADAVVRNGDSHRPAVGGGGHHHRPVSRRVSGGVGEEGVDDDAHRDGVGAARRHACCGREPCSARRRGAPH